MKEPLLTILGTAYAALLLLALLAYAFVEQNLPSIGRLFG